MALLACGDKTALEKIYGQEAPWLLRVAYRIVGQRDIADDVIQDAFHLGLAGSAYLRPQPRVGGVGFTPLHAIAP
jgi:DNA-directed RNA polymerase specialized sigma24 family protein